MNLKSIGSVGWVALGTRQLELSPCTAIVGPSGSGKSTLLHLVHRAREAIAPYGVLRPSFDRMYASGAPGGRLQLGFAFDPEEQSRFGVGPREDVELLASAGNTPKVDASDEARNALGHYAHDGSFGMMELVPAERTGRGGASGLDVIAQRPLRGLEDAGKYGWLESFYCDVGLGVPLGFEPAPPPSELNALLEQTGSRLRLMSVHRIGQSYVPVFRSAAGIVRGISEMSAGERQVALFVGLLLLLNPRRSIILVDMLERDLDPTLQAGVLGLLVASGNQVIFSTHADTLARAPQVTSVVRLGDTR